MPGETREFPHFHIVLIEPEIPGNTGTIGRLALGVGATLHLVGKLGFRTDERAVKRAGLDYWKDVKLRYHDALEDLEAEFPAARFFYVTKKARRLYSRVSYQAGDFLVFGKETAGLPPHLLKKDPDRTIGIPINDRIRSLNLANAVSIVSYELIRQLTIR